MPKEIEEKYPITILVLKALFNKIEECDCKDHKDIPNRKSQR